MLALFFALGASWTLLALLAAFFGPPGWFSCVLGRSGLDFGGARVAPGMVLEPQQPIFQRFYTLLR